MTLKNMRYFIRQMPALSGDSTKLQAPEDDRRGKEQPDDSSNNGDELSKALESIYRRGSSLFTSAISSRNIQMVDQVARLIERHYGSDSAKVRRRLGRPRPLCENIFLVRA